jgi:hypothetical protein
VGEKGFVVDICEAHFDIDEGDLKTFIELRSGARHPPAALRRLDVRSEQRLIAPP